MATKPLMCAKCEVAAEAPPKPQTNDMVVCPKCGFAETFENVQRSIAQQGEEYAARVMDKTLRGVASRTKGVTYTPGVIPKRNHDFIVQFE